MIRLIWAFTLISSSLSFEKCANAGLCLGHLIKAQEKVDSVYECLDICKATDNCAFASFHLQSKACVLSKSCFRIVLTSTYQHSSVHCQRVNKILTIGGKNYPDKPEPNIEITSLDSIKNCSHTIPDIGFFYWSSTWYHQWYTNPMWWYV